MMDYESFVANKLTPSVLTGLTEVPPLPESLFPFQRDLVRWALRRGRAALFADTGLGKSRCQLAWSQAIAQATGGDVLVLAPLSVTTQTAREAAAIEIQVQVCRTGEDVAPGVNITNYERLHRFDPSRFVGVVLDESSCIKHSDSKTLKTLLEAFQGTRYKLCATATPAPNDWTELGTHAEFLGICSGPEMLSEYFVHDGGDTSKWRLKGHARTAFWRWVSTWGAMVRKPSDLGYPDAGYDLPPLETHEHLVESDLVQARAAGFLFVMPALTLLEQRAAKKASLGKRVDRLVELVSAEPTEQWVVWCELNAEQDALEQVLGEQVASIRGSNTPEEKEWRHLEWLNGAKRILVSKASIFGFGLNWQHCARMAFVGINHSYEGRYQAIRRCWRFGQKRSVRVHTICSEAEAAVLDSLERKEAIAAEMAKAVSAETRATMMSEVRGATRETNAYRPSVPMTLPTWLTTEAVP